MKINGENFGLSTREALSILHDDVLKVLEDFSPKIPSRWDCMKNILHHNNEHSRYSWISALYILLISINLILSSFFTDISLYGNLAGQGILLLAVGILNIFLVSWDNQLRLNEIPERIRSLLLFIKECEEKCVWRTENYPHLCCPFSPCITLQWTYRDRRLVNLPWALLARGDVIVLRPGQPAPGNAFQQDNQSSFLASGEVYVPPQKHDNISAPTARMPLKNKRYVLAETPLLKNIKEILEESMYKNCITCYDKQIHLITSKVLQNLAVPFLIVSALLLSLLRVVYVDEWISGTHWSVAFLLIPASIIIPLVPIGFPAAWIALHTLGNAKLSAFLQSSSTNKNPDPFGDISIDNMEEDFGGVKWGQHFFHALLGKQHSLALTRSTNPLHVLGSVTALCCVDKKGILSWPNPTAEKIFFLKTIDKSTITGDSTINDNGSDYEQEEVLIETAGEGDLRGNQPPSEVVTRVEVLDLTHDLSCPFKLHFDDTRWGEHLGSLKPIGLAVLLNTCNMATQEHYVQFCSHVTCEALYNEDLVPVTNRRCPHFLCVNEVANTLPIKKCLCELAKQIGFTDKAKSSYHLHEQLCTFRHVQPETVRKDIKFARSLALATKLKLPFPHMVAVVTSEASVPNSLQLFSQATGDIALDSCVDFWDGATLRTLSSSDRTPFSFIKVSDKKEPIQILKHRKKILDFYQRNSLTAYCTAFAYRPLGRSVKSDLSKVYMELPADSHSLYLKNRSPTPISNVLHQSTDSLLTEEVAEEVSDIKGCFEMQCNQIFLGMVTMQYQAQKEMVQLIEQLEGACIRFVHFSKENELRSRTFSEKMGLESGWNCHISLLSSDPPEEENVEGDVEEEWGKTNDAHTPLLGANLCSLEGSRAMSVSAPCAINTELSKDNTDGYKTKDDEFELISQEGWQSLSCLSDSTEQSAPVNFDMSNRAKLPIGIDQIRPHLEQVDNVPLLVSLFTDCTPSTTEQMIDIMKDYGEIVCVMGSSENADNNSIFLNANASVSIEPLYPQVCQKVPVFSIHPDSVSPVQLSTRLNSLPCCVTIIRQRPVSIFQLIMQARNFMLCLWNCIQFWICSVVSLCLVQLITILVMLPPLLTPGQVLWLSLGVIPFLSFSLVHCPTNPQVMLKPVAKKQSTLNSEVALFVAWCYGSKFLPSLLLVPLVYGISLASFCTDVAQAKNSSCTLVYPLVQEPLGGWELHSFPYSLAQLLATSVLVLHLVTVSVSFVHREFLCWRRNPFKNKSWLITSSVMLAVQCLYFLGSVLLAEDYYPRLDIPWVAFYLALLSLPLVLFVNEFAKWQEIKANLRYEKRARLDFGTKLGMNSPF